MKLERRVHSIRICHGRYQLIFQRGKWPPFIHTGFKPGKMRWRFRLDRREETTRLKETAAA